MGDECSTEVPGGQSLFGEVPAYLSDDINLASVSGRRLYSERHLIRYALLNLNRHTQQFGRRKLYLASLVLTCGVVHHCLHDRTLAMCSLSDYNFKSTVVLEIEPSPLPDHAFRIVFPHMSVGWICPRKPFTGNRKRIYLIVRGSSA